MRSRDMMALGAAAATIALVMMRRRMRRPDFAFADERRNTVRVAGPREMADPPRNWSSVDEAADESFPASDPPATY